MKKTAAVVPDTKTEEKILEAARRIFTRSGFAAARMEDIAAEAGMNRALLHYYFRSKEKMFDMIFEENMKNFYGNFLSILSGKEDIEAKIRLLISAEIDMLLANQHLPLFMVNEIARDPELLLQKIRNFPVQQFFGEFIKQFEAEIKKGKIKKADPMQILMHIMSLCIFPFMGRPMLMAVSGMDQKQFEALMQQRKTLVADLIIASIKK